MKVTGDMIVVLVMSAFAFYMTRVFVKSLEDGLLYFEQWENVTKLDNPKEFRKAIRYHFVNIVLFDIGVILAVLDYFFGLDILAYILD